MFLEPFKLPKTMLKILEKTKVYARFEAWFIDKTEAFQIAFVEGLITSIYVALTILIVVMIKYD